MRKKVVRRPRKRAVKKRTPLAKLVKQIVLKQEETKMSSLSYNWTYFNSAINAVGDYNAVLPTVSAGTGQNQRVGAVIKPLKLVIRGYICYRADNNQGARMIGTRLFCFSDKTVNNYGVGISAGQNFRLLDGGGSAGIFDGYAMSYITPHNTDAFKWYADKKHTILKPFGYTNTLAPTASSDITGMDRSLYKPFTITIPASKMPSVLRYEESVSATQPVNFAPYIAVGYADLLNYLPDTASTQIGMEWVATLYYKDA